MAHHVFCGLCSKCEHLPFDESCQQDGRQDLVREVGFPLDGCLTATLILLLTVDAGLPAIAAVNSSANTLTHSLLSFRTTPNNQHQMTGTATPDAHTAYSSYYVKVTFSRRSSPSMKRSLRRASVDRSLLRDGPVQQADGVATTTSYAHLPFSRTSMRASASPHTKAMRTCRCGPPQQSSPPLNQSVSLRIDAPDSSS